MKEMLSRLLNRQFFSYLCVGGLSAIVEWILFALFANWVGMNYLFATCTAFIFSTLTNWFLGKIWTFKESKRYEKKPFKEIALIFLVSDVGLLFNVAIMYLFVGVVGLNTPRLKVCSKIMATGIVFIWNFAIRKYVVYR